MYWPPRLSFGEAKAAVRIARSGQFPTVTATPAATGSGTGATSGVNHLYTIPIDAVYQVDIWGSIRRGGCGEFRHRASFRRQNWRMPAYCIRRNSPRITSRFRIGRIKAVAGSYGEVVRAKIVQLTQNRYDGGVASKGDVALAQTQLETTRAQVG